jgi:hypothetical protein
MLRQEFNKGEKVRLDTKFANSSIVEVVSQTANKLFTEVKSDDSTWWVMTCRLEKILK